jgi:hypothetical protein
MARDDEVINTGRRDHGCDRDGLLGSIGSSAIARQQMRIVARNPVVIGDIRFEDGPYGSLNDAKLARSTIGACSEDDRRAG